MMIDGRRVQIDSELEDNLPAILRLEVTDDGELWVLTGRGGYDQPDGIAQTWDTFSPEGDYRGSVALTCPFDPGEDRLIVISSTEFVVVRQFQSAVAALRGGAGLAAEQGDAIPLTVSLWKVVP